MDIAVGELEAIFHGEGAANRSSDPGLQQQLEKIVGADLSAGATSRE
jgi:hypothetical protein